MNVLFDLPFLEGDIPSFANLSQMLLRPKSALPESIAFLELKFPNARIYRIALHGNIEVMLTAISERLSFPHRVSHSLDAFGDLMASLSWLNSKHVIVVLEMAEEANQLDQCMVIDAVSLAITHLNLERNIQLSVVIAV